MQGGKRTCLKTEHSRDWDVDINIRNQPLTCSRSLFVFACNCYLYVLSNFYFLILFIKLRFFWGYEFVVNKNNKIHYLIETPKQIISDWQESIDLLDNNFKPQFTEIS